MKKLVYKIFAWMLTTIEDRKNNNEYKVGESNGKYYLYHKSYSSSFGTSVNALGIISLGWFIPIINIGTLDYYIYNKEELDFIINHELGHCVYNHFKHYTKRDINDEIEADLYAMNIIGKEKSLHALEKLKDECKFRSMIAAAIELELRIQACKNN